MSDHDHDHDHDDELDPDLEDGEEGDDEDDDIVILSDAEGNEIEYQFLAIVEVDGEQYALLTPNGSEDEEEATEIFIFHYSQDEDGGECFADVPDEETFKKVQSQAEALFAADGDDEDVS
jgi:uncharacterized protein YrzB (UPF0473 family)